MQALSVASPIGPLTVQEDGEAITAVLWTEAPPDAASSKLLLEAKAQLSAYFDGKLKSFDLPLNPKGNPFYQSVFLAMCDIPYGETKTYGDIANTLGTYGQPVGQACGANPIPVIIPCHRVLSAQGLGGYSGFGGVDTKITLLRLEGGYPFLL